MMELSRFQHKTQVRVRNFEIDWQGIVHNAVYSLYFEVGRVDYFKWLGIHLDQRTVQSDFHVVLVTNNLTYKSPAHFDDLLDVYTRITYVKNTSFGMEGLIVESQTGRVIAENTNVHVWLDPRTEQPVPISDRFRKLVQAAEGGNVQIQWPTRYA
jgi:acyl-CoA thioester hydrolase